MKEFTAVADLLRIGDGRRGAPPGHPPSAHAGNPSHRRGAHGGGDTCRGDHPGTCSCRTGTTPVDTRAHRFRHCVRLLEDLPEGAWVAILDDRPLSRVRLRRMARRAGVAVERELLVLPSLEAPASVVEDVEGAVRRHWSTGASRRTAPGLAAPLSEVAHRVGRGLPWAWTGWLVRGRVVVARRS